MPTLISGIVDTEAILSDEKVVDMEPKFRLLDPDTSQFMTILNKLPSRPATREKINWLEDEFLPTLTTLAASATSAATTLSVATGTGVYFRAGDIVYIASSGEKVSVSSIATDDLTVVRGVGDVTAATAQTGVELVIIGNASAQGADYGTLKSVKRTLGYNYTQIFRHPFGFTGTDVEIETYGSNEPATELAKKAVEHKRAQELSSFVGARDFTSASPDSKGYMGGVSEYLSTNVFSAVGTLGLTSFDSKAQSAYQHGSMRKVLFAAPTPARALSNLFANNWVRARPEDSVYGAKVNAFIVGAYGESLPVIVKREWGIYGTSDKELGGAMFLLDLDYIRKRPLRNRNGLLLRNRQDPGLDQVVHEFLTECSMEVSVEKAHAVFWGVTG